MINIILKGVINIELKDINVKIYADYEEFKTITYPGVRENTYMISNFGNIIFKSTKNPRSTRIDKDGYLMIGLMSKNDKQMQYRVHRLVAWEFCSDRDVNLVVNHLDNCKSNNYFKNLEWATVSENTLHGYDHGNGKFGETHYKNKYPEQMIHEICKLICKGYNQSEIYDEIKYKFLNNVNHNRKSVITLIKDIRRRRMWRSVHSLYDF